jgi:mRNA-degrading endonuclease RelE of RelBE toxin-antitoxin system
MEILYNLAISEEAIAQLRRLPKEERRRIGARLTHLQKWRCR